RSLMLAATLLAALTTSAFAADYKGVSTKSRDDGKTADLRVSASFSFSGQLATNARLANPIDPHPEWGNPNGKWLVYWSYGPKDRLWRFFKSYNNKTRAQTIAGDLRGQGYRAKVVRK